MNQTRQRSILVTGAASGIGRATVDVLAAKGYRVFATYRADAHRAHLADIDGVIPVRMDVTDASDVEPGTALVRDAVGDAGLYAVVNNAGTTYAAPFELADEQRFRAVMEVNVMAPFRVTQAFLPLMVDHNRHHEAKARVINVASWAGVMSAPFIAAYNASKFALVGMTESMSYDLGLLDIHAVLAMPGITATPLLAKTTADGAASLASMEPFDQGRYRELFEHYATMGEGADGNKMLSTPEQAARRLARIADARTPRFKYYLGHDARFIDHVANRLPWRARAAANRRMYRLQRIADPQPAALEPAFAAS